MTSGTSLNMDYLGSQIIYEQLDKEKKRRTMTIEESKRENCVENAPSTAPTTQKVEQKPDTLHEAIDEVVQNEENKVLYYNNPVLHTFNYLKGLAAEYLFNPQPDPDPTKKDTKKLTEPLIHDGRAKVETPQEAQKLGSDRQKEAVGQKREHGISEYIKYGLL